jgi:DNA-binding transcriptional LysR family regulator
MSVEHLEFRLLKYIVAVADAGSFTAAAAKVHVSQSTLSTQIKALEDVLGVQIFDRDHGTALTPEGKVLLRYAREGLRTRNRVVQILQAIHAGKVMPLRLGFTPFVQKALLKSVTDLYRCLLPECDVIPESDDTDELTSRIRRGTFDIGILTLPINGDDLEIAVLEREPMMVCMRAEDPLAEGESVPPNAVNGKISIFALKRHHPAAYAQLAEMFEEIGISLRPATPTMNIDHIQWMVKEGVCYSLMRASRPLISGLVTRPIAGVDWTVDTAAVIKKDADNPALSWFIEELRQHFRVAAEMPEKKRVVSIPIRELSKKTNVRADANQMALFDRPKADGRDGHLRRLYPHRKEVLDE